MLLQVVYLLLAPILVTPVFSVSVTDIQGPAFQSPLLGQTVHDVTGVVTAKGRYGFWISGAPGDDVRISNGLSIYTKALFGSPNVANLGSRTGPKSASILNQVSVGDNISLSGRVSEYRSYLHLNDLFLTQLTSPTKLVVLSSNNTVKPVILGLDRSPPTQQLSALDIVEGSDGFLSVPNNQSQQELVNATLQPDKFGLDFWESLEGQLVVIKNPTALNFPTRFKEFWVRGDWPVTGKNGRGGLTVTFGPDGYPDANPESIIVGAALDGTKNPDVAIGTTLSDIMGVITYQYSFYYILPLTAPVIIDMQNSTVPTTSLSSNDDPCILTMADYNIENMGPRSHHLPVIASHIVDFLGTPDLLFLQEIQDSSGTSDDGTVDANLTLSRLVLAIANASDGVVYDFLDIAPINNEDGGQPGGNIRQAYLYRPERLRLVPGSPAGEALNATEPILDSGGAIGLTFNPGRIDPTNDAWVEARKPLAAAWQTASGDRLLTVNVHFSSKSGSSSAQGTLRTPVNGRVEQRTSQINVTATFVKTILCLDAAANVVVAGDFNEYLQTRSVYASLADVLFDVDETSGIDPVERYTYVYDQNTQQIDHIFVTDAIKNRGTEVEHVHINNWAPGLKERASDHDPSVVRIKLCAPTLATPGRPFHSALHSSLSYILSMVANLFTLMIW